MYKTVNQTYGLQQTILNLYRLPARLNADQVAAFLGFQPHDIPTLVSSKLLTPLGKPPPNGIKFFATSRLKELCTDLKWFDAATKAVNNHWHSQNLRKKASLAGQRVEKKSATEAADQLTTHQAPTGREIIT